MDGVFVDGVRKGIGNTHLEGHAGKLSSSSNCKQTYQAVSFAGQRVPSKMASQAPKSKNCGKGVHGPARAISVLQCAAVRGALFQAHGSCPKVTSVTEAIIICLHFEFPQVHRLAIRVLRTASLKI